jgi:hypothetical protein
MQSVGSTLFQQLRKVLFVLALVGLFSVGWVGFEQPTYAAQSTAVQPASDLESREAAYEEAKEIADDPKMGIEKEYEKEVEAYREENGEGSILEEVKELVTKATGN